MSPKVASAQNRCARRRAARSSAVRGIKKHLLTGSPEAGANPDRPGRPRVSEQAEFRDPRLVEVYDAECPWGVDDDWFLALATDTPGGRILDLGCGTGRLALAMQRAGLAVTGIDPAAASLAAARAKPGAEHVTWIEGTSSAAPTCQRLAVATSLSSSSLSTQHSPQPLTTRALLAALSSLSPVGGGGSRVTE